MADLQYKISHFYNLISCTFIYKVIWMYRELTAGCWLHSLHWCWNHVPQRPATLHWLRKRHLEPIHLKIVKKKTPVFNFFWNNSLPIKLHCPFPKPRFPFSVSSYQKLFVYSEVENSWMYKLLNLTWEINSSKILFLS